MYSGVIYNINVHVCKIQCFPENCSNLQIMGCKKSLINYNEDLPRRKKVNILKMQKLNPTELWNPGLNYDIPDWTMISLTKL